MFTPDERKIYQYHDGDSPRFGDPTLIEERYAEVVISTVHKAKGREWESVRITDFRKPRKDPDEDEAPLPPRDQMMTAYVAVTRAKILLDRGPLSFVDDYLYTPAVGGAS